MGGPLALGGQLNDIAAIYARIPSRRLVVLGEGGSGKTVLAVQFTLQQLATRRSSDPAAVIFNVSSWDPTDVSLRDWLALALAREYPGLSSQVPDEALGLAVSLVNERWILPVLDGFDEIPERLRGDALQALSATTMPLVLMSRRDEYVATVKKADVLSAAAGIELVRLNVRDLRNYLPRTTRPTECGREDSRWDTVLNQLSERPHLSESQRLTEVLTLPLMTYLARTMYSSTPDRDPYELLGETQFHSVRDLEKFLLGNYVHAIYGSSLPADRLNAPRNPRFDASDAERWLTYLASSLDWLVTYDLAWWQLSNRVWMPFRQLGSALAHASIGIVPAIPIGLLVGALTGALSGGSGWIAGLAASLAVMLLVGLPLGLLGGITAVTPLSPSGYKRRLRYRRQAGPEPKHIRIERGRQRHLLLAVVLSGAAASLAAQEKLGAFPLLTLLPVIGLSMAALLRFRRAKSYVDRAADPLSLLRADRTVALLRAILLSLVIAPAVSYAGFVFSDKQIGSRAGVIAVILSCAVGFALAIMRSAWGRWVLIVRLWLPMRGQLPWNFWTFVDDAYRRGVLRRSGVVYQFRHARLQDHLAHAGSDLDR